ncbi:type II toxin-antitoxin system RelE/ParE family toxin [Lactococcus garvieae]|uniref:type II toxin-antitoxin system RelE/ParE family toxin n=1 Tax=Lactococcus garvieae TaxID=1363 RepID=UPI001F61A158|nr:type II toxin-antitoxin system RelE/ParE family toxin [Lactococcus garvieae]MCI3861386.1 type II toxin-antitoxin system RelE/ParE family toxin [Lactococcus garvieae]
MIKYTVVVAEQVYRDTQEAVFYKESLGTYGSNISGFAKKVAIFIKKMETSPKIGSNLSLRIGIDTNVKYSVIEDYILFYEILGSEVYVLRLLPAKSNWMSTILKQI